MKLKKILASLTAAAMAVTTMAFAPLSVSADNGKSLFFGSKALGAWGEFGGIEVGEGKTISQSDLSNYSNLSVTFKVDKLPDSGKDWQASQVVKVYCKAYGTGYEYSADDSANKSVNSDGIVLGKSGLAANTEYTVDFSVSELLADFQTKLHPGDEAASTISAFEFQNMYQSTGSTTTITSIELTGSKAPGTYKTLYTGSKGLTVWGEFGGLEVGSGKPISVSDLSTYTTIAVTFKIDTMPITGNEWQLDQLLKIYCKAYGSGYEYSSDDTANKAVNSDGIMLGKSNAAVDTEYTLNFSIVDLLADLQSKLHAGDDAATTISAFEIQDMYQASGSKVTITKVELTGATAAPSVDSVTVTPATATLKIGETEALTAEVLPADATDKTVTWSSSDEKVATVDKNGKVTAVAAGTATIKAVSNADDTIYGSCEVTVTKNTYAVTVKSNNNAYGTASANVKEAAEGDTVDLTYTAAKGYKFSKWESEDVTVAKDGTFTMPAKEVTVTAVFEELPPDEFAINIAKPVNGKAVVKGGAASAVKGTVIDLVITPDKGYEVDTVKVNGEAITGTSFTMPENDVTIEVTFKKSTYTVTAAAAANGTVTADKATAQMGDTVTVTATPAADYELSKITVNGTAITGNTFTMPAENVTIAAEFKKIGSADAEVVVPEGVSVSFAGSKEDILKAVFGDDYAALVEAGYKLDVVMTVKDETAVSADDKALVEGALSDDMHIGLLIDVSLVMTKDGVSTVVANSSKPVSFAIGVPDSIIADGRTYSVFRVHDGAAEDIGGTYDAANKTITVSSDKYSTYAVVYKDAPAPQPEPTVTYSITADRNVTLTASSAAAGTQINVRVDFGYDAYVYCGGRVIDKITEGGSFTMPAGNVTIVTKANGYLAMVKNAAPNSYIFVYDADMNYIKTNGSVKGIKGEGKITVKLGEEYAGKTVTLYKGRKSTSVKLESLTLDKNGNATFTVEGGKNYTAVVE